MAWRLARSLQTLLGQVNTMAPNRSTASDGTIGDPAHAARASRHNPNRFDVVTALDITHDPGDNCHIHEIADHIRRHPHPQLAYIISNRRIASGSSAPWTWRAYHGSNPHSLHAHFAVGVGPDSDPRPPYDSKLPWNLPGAPPSTGELSMLCDKDDSGPVVAALQVRLKQLGYYNGDIDGDYGPRTSQGVLAMRRSVGSGAKSGDNFSGWAFAQLAKAEAIYFAQFNSIVQQAHKRTSNQNERILPIERMHYPHGKTNKTEHIGL